MIINMNLNYGEPPLKGVNRKLSIRKRGANNKIEPGSSEPLKKKIKSLSNRNAFLNKKLEDFTVTNTNLKRRDDWILNTNSDYYRNVRILDKDNNYFHKINNHIIGLDHINDLNSLQTFYRFTMNHIGKLLKIIQDNDERMASVIKKLSNGMVYKNGIKIGKKGFMNLASGKVKYHGLYGFDLIMALMKKQAKKEANNK